MGNEMQFGRTRQDACGLAGYMALYAATGDEGHQRLAERMLQNAVTGEEMHPAWARLLFADVDKWKETIEQVAQRELPAPARLEEAFDTLPFRMAYEMKLNRMAWVNRVAEDFRSLHQRLFDEKSGLHCAAEGEAYCAESTGWFLMALVDCIDICDQQLYEHWRCLVDIFRTTLRGMLRSGKVEGAELQLAYCILKAVRMGLIDSERYLARGLELAQAEHHGLDVGIPYMLAAEKALAGRCGA
ncbi:MAG: hypothetical protein IJX84_04780 [Clostridia bacterium]|nr:hypothetical protein [Clostridia bacterium]